jgi:hypothetical protein
MVHNIARVPATTRPRRRFEESTPDYVFGRRHVGAWTFYYLHFAGEAKKGTLALSWYPYYERLLRKTIMAALLEARGGQKALPFLVLHHPRPLLDLRTPSSICNGRIRPDARQPYVQ